MLGEIFGVDGIIVLIVVLALLFGGAAIPKLARSLGSAKNEFEKGLDESKKPSAATPVSEATPVVTITPVAPVAEHVTPGA
jgi:sec-independent protein translocase protein TatA